MSEAGRLAKLAAPATLSSRLGGERGERLFESCSVSITSRHPGETVPGRVALRTEKKRAGFDVRNRRSSPPPQHARNAGTRGQRSQAARFHASSKQAVRCRSHPGFARLIVAAGLDREMSGPGRPAVRGQQQIALRAAANARPERSEPGSIEPGL